VFTDHLEVPARPGLHFVRNRFFLDARARKLFSAGADTIEEDQALDDALYALRALQSCLNFRAAA
jgi:hypothetical protein